MITPSLTGVQLAKKVSNLYQTYSNVLILVDLDDDSVLVQTQRQRKVNYPNIEEAMSMWVERTI